MTESSGNTSTHSRKPFWSRRLRRAKSALKRGGPLALLVGAFRLYIVDYRRYYLYERRHQALPVEPFRPRLERFEEHFVAGNDEADLLAQEHEDFRDIMYPARHGLEQGAVGFCIYVGRELAHVAWLATTPAARKAFDHLGFSVRFDAGEAWTGAAWTVPAYRGKGLLTYSAYRRFEYLLERGFKVSRGAVEVSNLASQSTNTRFEPRVYAIGRQWRVFGRRWWSEREVTSVDRV